MPEKIVVGCDMGLTKSGIVVLNQDNEIYEQALIKVDTKGAQRLIDIETGLDTIIAPYIKGSITVFIEGYAYGQAFQRESLAELGGVIRRYLCLRLIDFWVISPKTLKLYVTGDGSANKNFMKKCTKDLWGHSFKSDDVCDAYGLARIGNAVLGRGPLPSEPKQLDIVADISNNIDHYRNGNTAKRRKKTNGR